MAGGLDVRGSMAPAARRDVVTTEAGGEVLVYDASRHHIHHLNAPTTIVWLLCDGTRTVSEIATASELADAHVRLALRKLAEANLLRGELPMELAVASPGRRRFLKKAGIAAIPAIVSVTAPLAQAAASKSCSGPIGVCSDEVSCCAGHECRNFSCWPI